MYFGITQKKNIQKFRIATKTKQNLKERKKKYYKLSLATMSNLETRATVINKFS